MKNLWTILVYLVFGTFAFFGLLNVVIAVRNGINIFGLVYFLLAFYFFSFSRRIYRLKGVVDRKFLEKHLRFFFSDRVRLVSFLSSFAMSFFLKYRFQPTNEIVYLALYWPLIVSETFVFQYAIYLKFDLGLGFFLPALETVPFLLETYYFFRIFRFALRAYSFSSNVFR